MASWSFEITEGFVVNEAIGDGVTQITQDFREKLTAGGTC